MSTKAVCSSNWMDIISPQLISFQVSVGFEDDHVTQIIKNFVISI